MTRLSWGELNKRNYEYGVDRVVFYPKNGRGYAWNGVTSLKESTADASQSLIYVDGIGHQNELLLGTFAAQLDAITYPKEFEPFDGYPGIRTGQMRAQFDFCYRTNQAVGYKLHLVFNCLASPTSRNNSSLNNQTEMELFSWDLTTRPEVIPDARAASHFIIDSTQVNFGVMQAMEDRLYGTLASNADMPTVPELLQIFENLSIFRVTDNGDGTATISGPDSAVHLVASDTAELTYASVIFIGDDTYQLSSL